MAYIENAQQQQPDDVHVVTQVVNSLLALLIFPVEKEQQFFAQWAAIPLPSAAKPSPSEVKTIKKRLKQVIDIPSLQVLKFDRCCDVATFFRKIRNALSHKNIEFDSDSLSLDSVTITLSDRLSSNAGIHWEVKMSAKDLRAVGHFLGNEIVKQGL